MLKIKLETIKNKNKSILFQKLTKFLDLGLIIPDVYLAGGALRFLFDDENESISDFDLFFNNSLVAEQTRITLELLGAKEVFKCPLGKLNTFKIDGMKIQIIKENYYPNIGILLDTFDINACRIAYVEKADGPYIYTFKSTIKDIRNKEVNIHALTHPNASFKRMLKYCDKDYTITNEAVDKFTEIVYNMGRHNMSLDARFYID